MLDTTEAGRKGIPENVRDSTDYLPWIYASIPVAWYGFSTFLHAATASISDQFLPGIGALRTLFSPGLLILVLLAGSVIFRRSSIVQTYRITAIAAMLINILLIMLIWNHSDTGTYQQDRSDIWSVVAQSLSHPNFSNRSYLSAYWCLVISTGHALLAGLLKQRYK